MRDAPRFIHVLYVRDEHGWFAQCLDYNIGAQGASMEEAEQAFFRTWRLQIAMDRAHGRTPFEGLGGAPEKYVSMLAQVSEWQRGPALPNDDDTSATIPPAYVINAHVERMNSTRVPHH